MKILPHIVLPSTLALALLASASVGAQPAPPPGAGPAAISAPVPADDTAPPPPQGPGGPRGHHPPPPTRGPSIRIEREANGIMRLDVHCADTDTAKSCADTALAVLDKVNAGAPGK